MTPEEKSKIREMQGVLISIKNKCPRFFNITLYCDRLGLVKAYGKTIDNKTNWVLTEKGERVLKIMI